MTRAVHMPWDEGAVSDIGVELGQKTIKTMCAKRVAVARTSSIRDNVTCPDCRREVEYAASQRRALAAVVR
jgi:hypothetical protein